MSPPAPRPPSSRAGGRGGTMVAGAGLVHKRTTLTATWKENLRQSCLDRARQRRRSPHGITGISGTTTPMDARYDQNNDGGTTTTTTTPSYSAVVMARQTVEQTMQQLGVSVYVTPSKQYREFPHEAMDGNCDKEMMINDQSTTGVHNDNDDDPNYYCMTEDEYLELLQEVEVEMKLAEQQQLEELWLEEQRYVEDQVAEYERCQNEEDPQHTKVPCPLCQEACLTQSCDDGSIVCPNNMDGSCPMLLEHRPNLTLESLREMLCATYDEHSCRCSHPLAFDVTQHNGMTCLRAVCKSCHGFKLLL